MFRTTQLEFQSFKGNEENNCNVYKDKVKIAVWKDMARIPMFGKLRQKCQCLAG